MFNISLSLITGFMYRCQHSQAPRYLTDHCTPVSDTVFRQCLCSASSHQVSVPLYRLSTYGRRAFSVAGPTSGTHYQKVCGIRSVLWTVTDSRWKHFYFHSTSVFSALEVCYENALYKFTFDIDIDMVCVSEVWPPKENFRQLLDYIQIGCPLCCQSITTKHYRMISCI